MSGIFANKLYIATETILRLILYKDSTKQVKSEGVSLGVGCCLCLGYFTIFLLAIGFGAILMHSSTVHKVESLHASFALYSLF